MNIAQAISPSNVCLFGRIKRLCARLRSGLWRIILTIRNICGSAMVVGRSFRLLYAHKSTDVALTHIYISFHVCVGRIHCSPLLPTSVNATNKIPSRQPTTTRMAGLGYVRTVDHRQHHTKCLCMQRRLISFIHAILTFISSA